MNPTPRLRWKGNDTWLDNEGCGITALQNTERYWWQSRHNLPDPPQLVDLNEFARDTRALARSPRALPSRGKPLQPAPLGLAAPGKGNRDLFHTDESRHHE